MKANDKFETLVLVMVFFVAAVAVALDSAGLLS